MAACRESLASRLDGGGLLAWRSSARPCGRPRHDRALLAKRPPASRYRAEHIGPAGQAKRAPETRTPAQPGTLLGALDQPELAREIPSSTSVPRWPDRRMVVPGEHTQRGHEHDGGQLGTSGTGTTRG